ncbi:MAG TPA: Lar family restriction alleviation protein [Candidatus Mediterraneibacter excrementigallinarum]|nr:Lar family restriction alleviation protein [Candidatus Mediterraneibacter excrementigallinarum]
MSGTKLKSCPFCGGEAKMKHGYPGQQRKGIRQSVVQCKKCGCRTVTYRQAAYQPWKEVDEQAAEVWNRREYEQNE